jgi:hypothetical protein
MQTLRTSSLLHDTEELDRAGCGQRLTVHGAGHVGPGAGDTLEDSPPGTLTTEEQGRMDRYRNNMGAPRVSRPHNLLPPELQKLDIWARSHFNPLVAKTGSPFEGEEFQALYEEAQREVGWCLLRISIREIRKSCCKNSRSRSGREMVNTTFSIAVTKYIFINPGG